MYIIQNVGKNEIALGDLRVTLRPQQKLDLDMICSRYVIEQSPSLRMAIKKGLIHILQKDDIMTSQVKRPVEQIKSSNDNVTKDELKEMEKRMTETLTAQMRKIADKEKNAPSIDPESLAALAPLVQQLTNIVKQAGGPATSASTQKPQETNIEEVDDKMVDIHTRSLNRMVKKVEGNIEHEEQKKQSDIADRASELEGLL